MDTTGERLTKTCSVCGESKLLTEYRTKGRHTNPSERRSYCKPCHSRLSNASANRRRLHTDCPPLIKVVDPLLEDRRFRLTVAREDNNGPREQFSTVVDGCVYVITNPDLPGVKIGWAGDPFYRLGMYQMYAPKPYELADYAHAPSIAAEDACHQHFADRHIRGEWFNVAVEEAVAVMKKICHELSTSGRT